MKLVKVSESIQTISASTGKVQQRRVAILQREDGHFTFAEEYHYKSEYEGEVIAEGWQRLPAEGIFERADAAETASRSVLQKT